MNDELLVSDSEVSDCDIISGCVTHNKKVFKQKDDEIVKIMCAWVYVLSVASFFAPTFALIIWGYLVSRVLSTKIFKLKKV